MELISIADQAAKTVSYTGTAGSTGNFGPGPQAVLVWTTTDAYVEVGHDVTATTSSMPIPAFVPILIKVPAEGDVWRVSAIQISSGGDVYAKPVSGAEG